MSWHRINLPPAEAGRSAELVHEFGLLFIAAGAPRGATLFSARDSISRDYYVSPEGARIATGVIRRYAAVKCSAPKQSSLRPVVGHTDLAFIPFAAELPSERAG